MLSKRNYEIYLYNKRAQGKNIRGNKIEWMISSSDEIRGGNLEG